MRSLFGERAAAPEQILTRLSRVFLTPFTYAIKRAPTCGFNSSVTESLSTLVRDGRFAVGDVEAIEIAMDDQDSEVLLYDEPTTALEAKFSVRFNAAVATLRKEHVLFNHGDDAVRDPEIRALLAKIHVRIQPAGEGRTRNGAVPVRVRLRTGEIIESATPPSEVEGATTKPLNPDRLAAKFRANAEAVLASDRAQALRATWTDLRAIDDVATAIALAGGA
jgi:2-methylcitrate dehydratase PrpD